MTNPDPLLLLGVAPVVVVCGGRGYHPTAADAWWVRGELERLGVLTVRQGACVHNCGDRRCSRRSVDVWAGCIAERLGLRNDAFPPAYELHGRHAPLFRNLVMLELEPVPVAVFAFPGGSGTGHTIARAKARGIDVVMRRAA